MKKKKQIPIKVDKSETQLKDFFDMISPSAVKFMADYFILGDKENVTLHIYSRYVDNAE